MNVFNRMYSSGNSIRLVLLMSEAQIRHSFEQKGYKPEYWGSRYTNYALDFYGLRGF